MTGGAGLDRLQGGNLADTFLGSTGNDTINGGAGTNTVDYSSLTTPGLLPIVQGGIGTVSKGGANGTDTLNGVAKHRRHRERPQQATCSRWMPRRKSRPMAPISTI